MHECYRTTDQPANLCASRPTCCLSPVRVDVLSYVTLGRATELLFCSQREHVISVD